MSSWYSAPLMATACQFSPRRVKVTLVQPSTFIGNDLFFCQGIDRRRAQAMSTTPRRRGAPRRDEPSARSRLIETATELFYQEGIRAIGIDTVVARSGVSKSSLYRTFASKDELIAAFAEEENWQFWQWWDGIVQRHA